MYVELFALIFQLFNKESRGSLSAEELSDLMGALLGVPQYNTAALHAQASSQGLLTEGQLLKLYLYICTAPRLVSCTAPCI